MAPSLGRPLLARRPLTPQPLERPLRSWDFLEKMKRDEEPLHVLYTHHFTPTHRASGRGRGSAQACRAGTGKAEKSEPCARAKALVLASLRRSEHPSPRVSKKHQAPRASRAPRGQGAGVRRPERTSVREDLRTGPATPTPWCAAAGEPGSGRRIAGVRSHGRARGGALRLLLRHSTNVRTRGGALPRPRSHAFQWRR